MTDKMYCNVCSFRLMTALNADPEAKYVRSDACQASVGLYENMLKSYLLVQALLKQSQHLVHASLHLVKASQKAPSLAGFRPLFSFTPMAMGCSYHAKACTILALCLPFCGMIQTCGIVTLLRQSLRAGLQSPGTSGMTRCSLTLRQLCFRHDQSSSCKQTFPAACLHAGER